MLEAAALYGLARLKAYTIDEASNLLNLVGR